MSDVIVHLPHASRCVPPDARAAIVLDDAELERELDRLTDHYTDELFTLDGTVRCVAPVSRFVVDVERFDNDDEEPMAARGMGAVYMRTTNGDAFRRPLSADERTALLDSYYHPHHQRLDALVEAALAAHDRALIVDGHSFPDTALPCDLDQAPGRPDICIGTDTNHTPAALIDAVVAASKAHGWTTAVDSPYAGTMVPLKYYGDERVASMMIEVNRRLYLDGVSRSEQFASVQAGVQALMRSAMETVARLEPHQ